MSELKFTPQGEYIFTVGELNASVKSLLENHFGSLWIQGEISGLSRPASGHCYFTLKENSGQIRCAFFRHQQQKSGLSDTPLFDGQKVLMQARVTLYPERGDYQLVVENVLDFGLGLLQLQFEALKKKLSEEGLFQKEFKKALPAWISTLAIVTSKTGAALQDVISVLKRRFPLIQIRVYHSAVQGENAPLELISAIEKAEREGLSDALLITRGGGSYEDLFAFNDERLIRAIFRCSLPVISAIGHEVDITLCDFVADLRAPTPSAAAEMLSPHQDELMFALQKIDQTLLSLFNQIKERKALRLQQWANRLKHPQFLLQQKREKWAIAHTLLLKDWDRLLLKKHQQYALLEKRLLARSPREMLRKTHHHFAQISSKLNQCLANILHQNQRKFSILVAKLETLSPLKTLARGYSIVQKESDLKVIKNPKDVRPGERLILSLQKGKLLVEVKNQ